jgi:hypothetical protein
MRNFNITCVNDRLEINFTDCKQDVWHITYEQDLQKAYNKNNTLFFIAVENANKHINQFDDFLYKVCNCIQERGLMNVGIRRIMVYVKKIVQHGGGEIPLSDLLCYDGQIQGLRENFKREILAGRYDIPYNSFGYIIYPDSLEIAPYDHHDHSEYTLVQTKHRLIYRTISTNSSAVSSNYIRI